MSRSETAALAGPRFLLVIEDGLVRIHRMEGLIVGQRLMRVPLKDPAAWRQGRWIVESFLQFKQLHQSVFSPRLPWINVVFTEIYEDEDHVHDCNFTV